MLISAALTQKLRESFGDEAADEMVDWMHRVETERSRSRELNDANFARYDALLGQRFAEFRHEIRAEIAEGRQEMRAGFAQLEVKFERRFNDMMRWSLLFWVSSLATVVALLRFR
jgi:hypothetical protein